MVAVVSARGDTTDELIEMAKEISDNPPAREMDMLLSTGERISAALVAMAIHELGYDAISLTGSQAGIVTDTVHTKAKILDIRPHRIRRPWTRARSCWSRAFQGVSTDQDVTTLGRGGSDTTAVALAAALGAEACVIFTDVDGIYTTDPRVVPEARKLDFISNDEMLELTASGAKVMMLRSIEVARRFDVPLWVRSSFTNAPGTLIGQEENRHGTGHRLRRDLRSRRREGDHPRSARQGRRGGQGLHGSGQGQRQRRRDHPERIRPRRGRHLVHRRRGRPAQDRVRSWTVSRPRLGFSSFDTDNEMAKVTLVGAGMRTYPGIAAKMFAGPGRERHQHRDDLHQFHQDQLRDPQEPGRRRRSRPCTRPSRWTRARQPGRDFQLESCSRGAGPFIGAAGRDAGAEAPSRGACAPAVIDRTVPCQSISCLRDTRCRASPDRCPGRKCRRHRRRYRRHHRCRPSPYLLPSPPSQLPSRVPSHVPSRVPSCCVVWVCWRLWVWTWVSD